MTAATVTELRAWHHALRHTQASNLIAAAVDVLTIGRHLGHPSPTIAVGITDTCSRIGMTGRPKRWKLGSAKIRA
jgi:hypothetical protein